MKRFFLAVFFLALLILLPLQASAADNNAQFVSQSVPTTMTAGQRYQVFISMKNTGTTTWTYDNINGAYALHAQNPINSDAWTIRQVEVLGVTPGETKTFDFWVTAPSAPGTYNFQWRMARQWAEWFGDLTQNVVVNVVPNPSQFNSAQYIAQSLPSIMKAGQTYQISILMKNNGSTTWTKGSSYRLGLQNSNNVWGFDRVHLGDSESIPPGSIKNFTFTVTAPSTPGTYNFQWKMLREFVEWFGDLTPMRNIKVVNTDTFDLKINFFRSVQSPYDWSCGVAAADLTDDSGNELVHGWCGDFNYPPEWGMVAVYNSEGQVVWTHAGEHEPNYIMLLDIGDVNNDGDNEIAVGYGNNPYMGRGGWAELLDKNGNVIWNYHSQPYEGMIRAVRIGEVTNNPGKEIVFAGGAKNGIIVLLNSTGGVIWEKPGCTLPDSPTSPEWARKLQIARIADINADGQNEIILAGGWYQCGNVRVLDKNGNELWKVNVGHDLMGLDVGDVIPEKPGLEIVLPTGKRSSNTYPFVYSTDTINRITLLDKDGQTIWQIPWNIENSYSAAITDLNEDGQKEIFIGYGPQDAQYHLPYEPLSSGGVAVLDRNGNLIGDLPLTGTIKVMERGDADADGKEEILASCQGGNPRGGVYVLDYNPPVPLPVITNVASYSVTENSASVSWTTDVAATSQVDYGETASYGSTTTLESNLVTSHSVALFGLYSGTTYHYRVRSKDESGGERVSGDYVFSTGGLAAFLMMNLDNNLALGETAAKVLDQSPYGNNGTAYNNVTWTIEAKHGNAARFDGDSDYIQTAANNALDNANAGTVTAWIKTSSSAMQTIAAYTTSSSSSSNYVWRIRNNVLDMAWNFAGAGGNWNLINGTTPVNDGNWHFVAFVSDGLNRNKIYLDGIEQTTTFTSTGGSSNDRGWTSNVDGVASYNHHINIGGLNRGFSPQGWFNGTIDHVRIWKKALSQQEIMQLFNEQFSSEFNVVSRTLPAPYVWGVGVAIGNLTNDAGNEIVFGGSTDYNFNPYYGEFFAYNSLGNIIWSHQSPNRNYAAAVDIGDVDNDGDNEVAVGFLGPKPIPFELLDNNGNLLWRYTYSNEMIRGVRIADVTSNPGKEILLAGGGNTGNGEVILLDSSGNEVWKKIYTCDGHLCKLQQARIADVNMDGSNEIVVVGGWYTWAGQVRGFPNVHLLDKNGVELWTKAIGEDTLGVGIDELAASRSGLEIVVVSAIRSIPPQGSNNVTLLDSSGNTIWKIPFPYPLWSVVTGDINNDGEKEIFVGYGTKDASSISIYDVGGVSIIDKNGAITGDIKLLNSIKFIEFGDANNDGKSEIIASSDGGKVYIISKTNSGGSAADLNGDNIVDIADLVIVATDFGKKSGFEARADTDNSGEIDIFDITFVASRFT